MNEAIKFNYESIRTMPVFARIFCMNFGGWLVGSAAKFVCSLSNEIPKDWDVVVPLRHWPEAVKVVPYQTVTNTFGGFKITENDGRLVDVWPEDFDTFILTMRKSPDGHILVQPRTQVVLRRF